MLKRSAILKTKPSFLLVDKFNVKSWKVSNFLRCVQVKRLNSCVKTVVNTSIACHILKSYVSVNVKLKFDCEPLKFSPALTSTIFHLPPPVSAFVMEKCNGLSLGTHQPVASVTRIECFSACHRLHSPSLSDKENLDIYGKCNNLNGHGHNYRLEVTVRGPVDPVTGMVINISELKRLIQCQVTDVLDHKNIDKDVAYFSNVVSTTENIAIFAWRRLRESLPAQLDLRVLLHETDKNVVTYSGP